MCERFGSEGARLVLSSRRQEHVDHALQHLKHESGLDADRLHGVQCDVGRAEDRRRLVEEALARFGRIDVLVSHAGINPNVGGPLDYSPAQWDRLFAVNLKANFELTRLCAPVMRRQG